MIWGGTIGIHRKTSSLVAAIDLTFASSFYRILRASVCKRVAVTQNLDNGQGILPDKEIGQISSFNGQGASTDTGLQRTRSFNRDR